MNINLITLIVHVPLIGAEYWTLRKTDGKYLESDVTWANRVRSEELFDSVKEERNILQTTKGTKAKRIGHILRRNCILKHVIEGKTEVKGRRGRRLKNYWTLLREREDTEQ